MLDTRYKEFCDVLKQVSRHDTISATAPSELALSTLPSSSIAPSTSSTSSVSNSISNTSGFALTISSTPDTSPATTPSSSASSLSYSNIDGIFIADDTDPAAATVAAPPIVLAASLASTSAPGSSPTPNPALAPAPAPGLFSVPALTPATVLAVAPVPVVAPVVPATVGPQPFVHNDDQIHLPLETLELILDSTSSLEELLFISTSTHGLRAAASHKIRTVHLQNATLDARTWLRAANVAYPRSCKAIRGRRMSLVIDLEGEKDADVRFEAQCELKRLLPFIEVLHLSSRHCALLPTLFDAPAPLLRELDFGNGTMSSMHAPGPLFGGSASRLTTLAASSTALRAAVSHSSFWTNTPALKNVRVYPDVVGTVRTAALQEAVRFHALNVVDVRGTPDSTGAVDIGNRFKTAVLKLSMRSLAAFCDMALRVTAESIGGVTDHLVLVGAGASSRAAIAAFAFLEGQDDSIVFCGIFAVGDAFQVTLRTESGRSCSITGLSKSDLVGLLVDRLVAADSDVLQSLRTMAIPWRASADILAAIIRVLASVQAAINIVAVASPHLPLDAAGHVSLAHPALQALLHGSLKVVGFRFQHNRDMDEPASQRFDSECAQIPAGNGKQIAETISWPEFAAAVKAWRPFGDEICVSGVLFEDAPFGQLYTDSGARVTMEKTPWTV